MYCFSGYVCGAKLFKENRACCPVTVLQVRVWGNISNFCFKEIKENNYQRSFNKNNAFIIHGHMVKMKTQTLNQKTIVY